MMIGTTLLVVTPGYATIGLAAPAIIMLAPRAAGVLGRWRIRQRGRFSRRAGGERRGYSASWQWASTGLVSIVVALFGIVLTTKLSHEELVDWGWRIPYLFGLLVGPAGLYIRSKVVETKEFAEAKPHSLPIRTLLATQPLQVILALGASVVSNASYYLLLYIPTYAIKTLHLHPSTGFIATLVGGAVLTVFSFSPGIGRTRPTGQGSCCGWRCCSW